MEEIFDSPPGGGMGEVVPSRMIRRTWIQKNSGDILLRYTPGLIDTIYCMFSLIYPLDIEVFV